MKFILKRAKRSTPKRVVFADAENLKVLESCSTSQKMKASAIPILLGNVDKIHSIIAKHNHLDLCKDVQIIDTRSPKKPKNA